MEERRRATRRRAARWGVAVVAAAAVVWGALALAGGSVDGKGLTFGTVDRGTLEAAVNGSGRVAPALEQIINSPIGSKVVEVYCKEGDRVEAGTPLLRLDLLTAENELDQLADQRRGKEYEVEQTRINNHTRLTDLEMQLKVKEMETSRLAVEVANERRLDSIGSGTGDRVRQAELLHRRSVLELEQLRRQLANERSVAEASMHMKHIELDIFNKNLAEKRRTIEDARLKAPVAGTVTFLVSQLGQQVGAGERVAVLSDLSRFKVNCEIADGYADRVAVGSRVKVMLGNTPLEGTVTTLTPLSKNGVIHFTTTLADDANPRLRSGLKADVYVVSNIIDDALRLPNGGYYKGPGKYYLYVREGTDRLVRRAVELGESNNEYVEVRAGLQPGEVAVTSGMSDQSKTELKIK